MIGLSEQLLQSLNELESHHLLAAIVVGLNHHGLECEGLSLTEGAALGVCVNRVLPLVLEWVIHEVRWSLL